MVDRIGNLIWEKSARNNTTSRNACFSTNETKVLAGDVPALFDVQTGEMKEVDWNHLNGQRNCAFYSDNSGFVVGAREMAGFDSTGKEKWMNILGEFPLFMAIDSKNTVYAAGKSMTLFSFDVNGKLRWKHKMPSHLVIAGAITPDGNRIVVGTLDGMVHLYDSEGNLLWKRNAANIKSWGSIGHNAIAISKDGKTIVSGTAPENCLTTYNETGTIISEKCFETDTTNPNLLVGVQNIQISKDGKEIIAAYGDNYIRKFELR